MSNIECRMLNVEVKATRQRGKTNLKISKFENLKMKYQVEC
jgi:hypothetical protein